MEANSLNLVKLNEVSEGESVIFVGPEQRVRELVSGISQSVVCLGFVINEPEPQELLNLSKLFKELISKDKLSRLTLVGVDWGGALVIHYAANNIKNVRRVVFVDAVSRPKQHLLEKSFEWLERFLPLGLPFRAISKAFDPRPIIHRVRCPVLVVTERSIGDSLELKAHSKFLMDRLPNAWSVEIEPNQFCNIFDSFFGVSTKQPQKVLRGAQ